MKVYLILLFVAITGSLTAQTQTKKDKKPTIVFVHGIWADGTSFASQITALLADGYNVRSVQNPITSLADDVAATQRVIDQIDGKVILVGHSWGGFVISQFSKEPKVAGLVYLAAFAPEKGETIASLNEKAPKTDLSKYLIVQKGFVFLSKDGVKSAFASDLRSNQQDLIYATQTPASHAVFTDSSAEPAWKNKPTWYVIAKNDHAIHPDLERLMAKRMKAKTIEISSSHVVMNAHPEEILHIILDAANYKY